MKNKYILLPLLTASMVLSSCHVMAMDGVSASAPKATTEKILTVKERAKIINDAILKPEQKVTRKLVTGVSAIANTTHKKPGVKPQFPAKQVQKNTPVVVATTQPKSPPTIKKTITGLTDEQKQQQALINTELEKKNAERKKEEEELKTNPTINIPESTPAEQTSTQSAETSNWFATLYKNWKTTSPTTKIVSACALGVGTLVATYLGYKALNFVYKPIKYMTILATALGAANLATDGYDKDKGIFDNMKSKFTSFFANINSVFNNFKGLFSGKKTEKTIEPNKVEPIEVKKTAPSIPSSANRKKIKDIISPKKPEEKGFLGKIISKASGAFTTAKNYVGDLFNKEQPKSNLGKDFINSKNAAKRKTKVKRSSSKLNTELLNNLPSNGLEEPKVNS